MVEALDEILDQQVGGGAIRRFPDGAHGSLYLGLGRLGHFVQDVARFVHGAALAQAAGAPSVQTKVGMGRPRRCISRPNSRQADVLSLLPSARCSSASFTLPTRRKLS